MAKKIRRRGISTLLIDNIIKNVFILHLKYYEICYLISIISNLNYSLQEEKKKAIKWGFGKAIFNIRQTKEEQEQEKIKRKEKEL